MSSAKALLDAETNPEREEELQDEEGVRAAEQASEQQERREAEIETAQWAREDHENHNQVQTGKQRETVWTE